MKLINKITMAAALLGGSISVASAASYGDLILGFSATGAANNYEVNLGSYGTFLSQAAGTTTTLSGLSTSTLLAQFQSGASWNTNTSLRWGVVGVVDPFYSAVTPGLSEVNSGTVFGTKATATAGGSGSGWANAGTTQSVLDNGAVKIQSIYSGSIGSMGTASSKVVSTASLGSWSAQKGTGAAAFNFFNPATSLMQGVSSSGSTYADLWMMQAWDANVGNLDENFTANPSGSTLVGTFALSSTGALTFTTPGGHTAVPESSSVVALLGVSLLGMGLIRRRMGAA